MKQNNKTVLIEPKVNPSKLYLPFFQSLVQAGFPSPAEDFTDTKLDLNQFLIKHPSSTFFVRVAGDSMIEAGIFENDLVIVDRSLTPTSGQIILAVVEGEFTIKKFVKQKNDIWLYPANSNYQPLKILEGTVFQVWGVVTYTIKKTSQGQSIY